MHPCSGSATRVCWIGGCWAGVLKGYGVDVFDYAVRGRRDRICLSTMATTYHNCVKRYDSREMCMTSLLRCPGELARAYGGMNGVESLCTGIGLKFGVW